MSNSLDILDLPQVPGEFRVKIYFLVSEYFRWGKYGGYGTSTRLLATELVRRGFDVTVLTPRRGEQPPEEDIDGVSVRAYAPQDLLGLARLCRQSKAHVFHSHEPSMATAIAMMAAPACAHVVTCRDTRLFKDWLIELSAWIQDGSLRTLLTFPYENNLLVRWAVRRADALFCPNEFSRPIAQRKYGLAHPPEFLPSPIRLPRERCSKAERPKVCYLGRWDSRKRPVLFFELAARFPKVEFVAMGQGRDDKTDRRLRARYEGLPNLSLPGFVDQFSSPLFAEILGSSWILVNTALREGLPRSFLEAAGHGCAILSRVDPDGFASRFGCRVVDDDFGKGLAWLLEADRWKALGEAGCRYVSETYGLETAVARHADVYRRVAVRSACRRSQQCLDRPAGDGRQAEVGDP